MDYNYSALMRNELSSHKETWRIIKYILLSVKKDNLKRLHTVKSQLYDTWEKVTLWTVKRSMVAMAKERDGWTGRIERIFRAVKLLYMIL